MNKFLRLQTLQESLNEIKNRCGDLNDIDFILRDLIEATQELTKIVTEIAE